jgi:hypothetical protein
MITLVQEEDDLHDRFLGPFPFPLTLRFLLAKHASVTGVTPEFTSEHRSCI